MSMVGDNESHIENCKLRRVYHHHNFHVGNIAKSSLTALQAALDYVILLHNIDAQL